jgi:hypothetical protein
VDVVPQTPDTPVSFTATAVSSTQIDLSWAPGPNGTTPDDYDLDWSLTGTGGWNAITFVGTATTYQHTGRTPGTTYYYRLRALAGASASGYVTTNKAIAGTATYTIAASTASRVYDGALTAGFNGANWVTSGGVTRKPTSNDVIELEGGTHGKTEFKNLLGAANNRITIRPAAGGVAIFRSATVSSSGFVVQLNNCRYVNVDGYSTGGTDNCGIKIMYATTIGATKDAPSAWLRVGDTATNVSSFLTVSYVEIDGGYTTSSTTTKSSNGIGLSVNDKVYWTYRDNCVSTNNDPVGPYGTPKKWRESLTFEHMRIRNVEGEGMYIGPNWYDNTPAGTAKADGGIPLRNIIVRHNLVENTGWDCINTKSWMGGTNLIHDNVVNNGSLQGSTSPFECGGILQLTGCASVYNNVVNGNYWRGIQVFTDQVPSSLPFGPWTAEVYNNVVVDIATVPLDATRTGRGIAVGAGSGSITFQALIYNNTVVDTPSNGISVGNVNSGSVVANNILADASTVSAGTATTYQNRTGTAASMGFVSVAGEDYRLTAGSASVDVVTNSYYPATDILDVARPQGVRADQGAYERESDGP